jgi:glycosyltransferase involved in cell wall biosynthesis
VNIFYLAADPRMRLSDEAGYATHMKKTIAAFIERGHRVTSVIGGELSNLDRKRKVYKGLKRKALGRYARILSEIHEIFHDQLLFKHCSEVMGRSSQISFVYERISPFHCTGLKLSKKFGVPLILEVNDPFSELSSFYPFFLKKYLYRIEDRLLENAHAVIVGSKRLGDHLVTKGIRASKIKVVYPTADYKLFNPMLKGEVNVPGFQKNDLPIIGYIGSMRKWHRADMLLLAIEKLEKTRLMIVGDGPEREVLKELAKRLKIEDRVIFVGSVSYEMVPAYIKMMDVCAIPNATWYGSPTKLFEYGAMAKAIVGPKNTPVDEVIDSNKLGCLFEPGNIRELTSLLSVLSRDKDRANIIGANLYQKLKKEITWEKNVEMICGLV